MKWSWKLGEVAGIGIFVHSTFLILLIWIGLSYWQIEQSIAAVAEGIGFILSLFCCVVLHELGHALAAQRYGIKTRDITLLPIGGLARLERMPEDPKQELVVAMAGPLVNVVIASALFLGLLMSGNLFLVESISITEGSFVARLMLVNVILVIFNMLPAFPMDGGRVLRALLATRMDYAKATQIAASIGQAMALGFGFLGLFSNPFLVIIALFVWIGAAQEANAVQIKSAIAGVPVSKAMLTNYQTLRPEDSLQHVVDLTLSGSQKDFPVTQYGAVVGVLTQTAMLRALTTTGPETIVKEIMQTDVEAADSEEMLEAVLARLANSQSQTIPVIHNGQLVGVITMDNIGELLRIQTALTASSR